MFVIEAEIFFLLNRLLLPGVQTAIHISDLHMGSLDDCRRCKIRDGSLCVVAPTQVSLRRFLLCLFPAMLPAPGFETNSHPATRMVPPNKPCSYRNSAHLVVISPSNRLFTLAHPPLSLVFLRPCTSCTGQTSNGYPPPTCCFPNHFPNHMCASLGLC